MYPITLAWITHCGLESDTTQGSEVPLKFLKRKRQRNESESPSKDLPSEVRAHILKKREGFVDVRLAPPRVPKVVSPRKPAAKPKARRRRFAPKRRVADKFEKTGVYENRTGRMKSNKTTCRLHG